MSNDSEIVALLFTQFLNGQINGQELSQFLAKERERGEEKLAILQKNLIAQQAVIDSYVSANNRQTIEIYELNNLLSETIKNRDYWKEESTRNKNKYYNRIKDKLYHIFKKEKNEKGNESKAS